MDELIVLLDDNLKPIGSAPKLASHHAATPLHLAFSCYVFNPAGQLLVTRRAAAKKVWPGVWTNSFCGHPMPDESFEAAIRRRGSFELRLSGLADVRKVLADYRYRTPPFNGIIENEFCPVFTAVTADEPRPNPAEVDDYRWLTIDELQAAIAGRPGDYSYWLKDQLPQLCEIDRLAV